MVPQEEELYQKIRRFIVFPLEVPETSKIIKTFFLSPEPKKAVIQSLRHEDIQRVISLIQ